MTATLKEREGRKREMEWRRDVGFREGGERWVSAEKQRRDERQTVKQVHKVEKEGEGAADQMYTLPKDGLQFRKRNVEKNCLDWLGCPEVMLFTKYICLASHKIGCILCIYFSFGANMQHGCLFLCLEINHPICSLRVGLRWRWSNTLPGGPVCHIRWYSAEPGARPHGELF